MNNEWGYWLFGSTQWGRRIVGPTHTVLMVYLVPVLKANVRYEWPQAPVVARFVNCSLIVRFLGPTLSTTYRRSYLLHLDLGP